MGRDISPEFKMSVFKKYFGRCAYCGNKIDIKRMTVDHFLPKAHKEKHKVYCFENMYPSCFECNVFKAHKSIDEFRTLLQNLINPEKEIPELKFQSKVLKKYIKLPKTPKPIKFFFETHKRIQQVIRGWYIDIDYKEEKDKIKTVVVVKNINTKHILINSFLEGHIASNKIYQDIKKVIDNEDLLEHYMVLSKQEGN